MEFPDENRRNSKWGIGGKRSAPPSLHILHNTKDFASPPTSSKFGLSFSVYFCSIPAMPPLVPSPSALRGLSIRAFSTTAASRAPPPRETPHHRPSSISSLLSINNPVSSSRSSNSGSSRQASSPGDVASNLMTRLKRESQSTHKTRQSHLELLRNQKNSNDYLKQMPRRWDAGDVYSPHDMSPVEMQKWRKRSPRGGDVIDALGIRPLDMYKV